MAAINSISNEEIRQRAIEMAKLRAVQAKGVEGTPAPSVSAAPVRTPGVGSGELVTPQDYQLKVAEIARRNGEATKGVNPESASNIGAAYTPQQLQAKVELPSGSTDAVLAQRAAYGVATPNAVKYISQVASSPYQQTANNYPNMDVYSQLAKIRLG